jgi:hypothetical protein
MSAAQEMAAYLPFSFVMNIRIKCRAERSVDTALDSLKHWSQQYRETGIILLNLSVHLLI